MKLIYITLVIFLCSLFCFYNIGSAIDSNYKHHDESYYQEKIAQKIHGKREVILDDKTRIDIVTDIAVIEVEFPHKFFEAIGQSAWYAYKTNKLPVIWLIKEQESDQRFIDRCKKLCNDKLQVKIKDKWTYITVNIYDNTGDN